VSTSTVLAVGVLVAALACPAHMLWRMRGGRRAACGVPAGRDELGELRARHQALGERLAAADKTPA